MAITTQMRTEVSQLYVALFGRAPDGEGLGYWVQLRDQGQSLTQIANTMYATTPARTYFPSFLTNGEIIAAFYTNVLGRSADTEGLAFWTGKLNAAGATPGSVIAEMISVVATYAGTDTAGKDSAALFNNKVTVAQYYGEKNGNISGAQTVLQTVTKDAASVTTAKAAVDAGTVGGINQGQTYSLLTSADNIVGTSGNDTINAVAADTIANGATLNVADVIDGAGGTDALNIIIADNGVVLPAATIKNVEKIYFKELVAVGTHSLANATGVTEVWSNGSTQDVAVNNVQANAVVGVDNSASNMMVDFKAATFGASGAVVSVATNNAGTSATARSTITVGQATAAGTGTDGVLNFAATGSSFITFAEGGFAAAADYKTVNITGTGKVDIAAGTLFDNTTTVNASTNTGGATIAITGNAKDVTVTGGTGADKVSLSGFNDKDTIDLGAGNDTLSIALTDATALTKAANVKNVEVLELTGDTAAAATINADLFGVNSFTIAGAIGHDVTLTNTANGGTVTVNKDSTAGSLVVDVKGAIAGTADTLTLTTDKDGAVLTTLTTLKIAGVETLNVTGNAGTGAGAFTLGTLEGAALKTIVITSAGGGAVTIGALTNAKAVTTIDASAATGATTTTGAAASAAVTFKGGSKVDTYTASTKGDSITGGAGADVINLDAAAATDKLFYTAASESTATAKDVVANFQQANDLISFAASLQVGTAVYLGNAAFSATAAKTQLRMNGADLEVDFNGDGTADSVITLTGQTFATFGAANFTFA